MFFFPLSLKRFWIFSDPKQRNETQWPNQSGRQTLSRCIYYFFCRQWSALYITVDNVSYQICTKLLITYINFHAFVTIIARLIYIIDPNSCTIRTADNVSHQTCKVQVKLVMLDVIEGLSEKPSLIYIT